MPDHLTEPVDARGAAPVDVETIRATVAMGEWQEIVNDYTTLCANYDEALCGCDFCYGFGALSENIGANSYAEWLLAELNRLRHQLAEARGHNAYVEDTRLIASQMAAIADSDAERDALQRRLAALTEAGNTLSAYIYSIGQPGSIPQSIRQAMRALDADAQEQG